LLPSRDGQQGGARHCRVGAGPPATTKMSAQTTSTAPAEARPDRTIAPQPRSRSEDRAQSPYGQIVSPGTEALPGNRPDHPSAAKLRRCGRAAALGATTGAESGERAARSGRRAL
jgi:hypothetical protein